MHQIDLNADLGEGGDHDEQLLTLVSSANISCGAHAGDGHSITRAIRGATLRQVHIGAHPSYPDREHFGRRQLDMDRTILINSLQQQLNSLQQQVITAGARLSHVKPHGALYNQAARDRRLAELVVAVIRDFDSRLALMALAGSELQRAGEAAGMHTLAEAFADRAYCADGSLLPRHRVGAVISDPGQVIRQSLQLIQQHCVYSVDGQRLSLRADTLCLHGDGAQALMLAQTLREALIQAKVAIARKQP